MRKNKYRTKPLTYNDYRVYMRANGEEYSRTVNCTLEVEARIEGRRRLAFALELPEGEIEVIRVVQLTFNQRKW